MSKHLLIFILLFSACTEDFSGKKGNLFISKSEEYDVYSTLVNKLFIESKTKIVVIRNKTIDFSSELVINYPDLTGVEKSFPPLLHEVVLNFKSRNKERQSIERLFKLEKDYTLIDDGLAANVLKDMKKFDVFLKEYPNSTGIISLSRVGFSSTSNQSLVYAIQWCGDTCSQGRYFILAKVNSKWVIEKEMIDWIA